MSGEVKTTTYGASEYITPLDYKLSISRGKKPIPTDGKIPEYIQAIKGIGYRCPQFCRWVPIRQKSITASSTPVVLQGPPLPRLDSPTQPCPPRKKRKKTTRKFEETVAIQPILQPPNSPVKQSPVVVRSYSPLRL